MTREALRRLRARVGVHAAELRARPLGARIDATTGFFERFVSAASGWRDALSRALPEATGLHPATVRAGLELACEGWDPEDWRRAAHDELCPETEAGPTAPSGFAVVLGGTLPMPALTGILGPLTLGAGVLARPGSQDPVTASLASGWLDEIDPTLGGSVAVVEIGRADGEALDEFLSSGAVSLTGSDEAIAALRARVPARTRVVAFGHRFALAALGPEAPLGAAAESLAHDVAHWDQLGCLSPVACFVVSRDPARCDAFAEALAGALARRQGEWPRGAVAPEVAEEIVRERAEAEMRAAAGLRVSLLASRATDWTVVREDDARMRPAPLHRFVRVHPVADGAALLDAWRPVGAQLSGVGLEGFAEAEALAARLVSLGASRVCPFGRMQSPPLSWDRGAGGVFRPLLG